MILGILEVEASQALNPKLLIPVLGCLRRLCRSLAHLQGFRVFLPFCLEGVGLGIFRV